MAGIAMVSHLFLSPLGLADSPMILMVIFQFLEFSTIQDQTPRLSLIITTQALLVILTQIIILK